MPEMLRICMGQYRPHAESMVFFLRLDPSRSHFLVDPKFKLGN